MLKNFLTYTIKQIKENVKMPRPSLKTISNDFIIQVAKRYLISRSLEDLMYTYYPMHSIGWLSDVMFKGVSENILNDHLTNMVCEKMKGSTHIVGYRRTANRWDIALTLRQNAIQNDIFSKSHVDEEKIKEFKKEELLYQLESFDDYFFDEEGAPSKQNIENKLYELARSN